MESTPNDRLTVVVITYNSTAVLPGLLNSLPAGLAGIADADVVVVDNASADGSARLAAQHPTSPRVIMTGRNGGFAAGINAAMAVIPPDRHVLILNPDIRLFPGCARFLLDRLADNHIGIVVPRMLEEDGATAPSLRREPSLATAWFDAVLGPRLAARLGVGSMRGSLALYETTQSIEWATGAALLVAARTRQLVGDWDESFFLYGEEVEYQRRVRERDLAIVFEPRSRMTHIGGEYTASPYLSALLSFNQVRYFARHHGPVATALFRLSLIAYATLRLGLAVRHRSALRGALRPQGSPVTPPAPT
jgi:GT2 family glycosyltransferase